MAHLIWFVCSGSEEIKDGGEASWLCSQNNRGNSETGTKPQGAPGNGTRYCERRKNFVCVCVLFSGQPTCKAMPFHEVQFQSAALIINSVDLHI